MCPIFFLVTVYNKGMCEPESIFTKKSWEEKKNILSINRSVNHLRNYFEDEKLMEIASLISVIRKGTLHTNDTPFTSCVTSYPVRHARPRLQWNQQETHTSPGIMTAAGINCTKRAFKGTKCWNITVLWCWNQSYEYKYSTMTTTNSNKQSAKSTCS